MFAKWIALPRPALLINQWANVVRWEMRTRLFLRTTEFLWQEGHTAHATAQEAREETQRMLEIYSEFAEQWMAMPVIMGEKSEAERFPGAVSTYCIEAMMQDRKALQAGTSHFLGQNFSKAQEIRFQDEAGKLEHAWTTSWGVSTRLIGALIMTHSDDDGLILPPKLAPSHIVILPITAKAEKPEDVIAYCKKLRDDLQSKAYAGRAVDVVLDERDIRGGDKIWGWVKKGIPLRVEVGPRDMAAGTVFVGRRDKSEKESMARDAFVDGAVAMLDDIQQGMLARAREMMASNTRRIDSKEDLYAFFTPENAEQPEIHGGFALMHWSGEREVEEKLKAEIGVTLRCIPSRRRRPGVCP